MKADIVSIRKYTGSDEFGYPTYSKDYPDKGFFHSWITINNEMVHAIIVKEDGVPEVVPIWQIRFDTLNGSPR